MALCQTFIRIFGWVRLGHVLGHASSKKNPSFQVSNFAMIKSDWWFDWHEHPSEKRRDENSNVANEKKLVLNFSPKNRGDHIFVTKSFFRVLSEVILCVSYFLKTTFTMKTLSYLNSLSSLPTSRFNIMPWSPDRRQAWLFAASQYSPS